MPDKGIDREGMFNDTQEEIERLPPFSDAACGVRPCRALDTAASGVAKHGMTRC